MSSSSNSSLCIVCAKAKANYKCPKCRSVYCSLGCNKAHKLVCHHAVQVPVNLNQDVEQPLIVASQTLDLIAVTSEAEKHDCMTEDTEVRNSTDRIETEVDMPSDTNFTTEILGSENIESEFHVMSESSVSDMKNNTDLDKIDLIIPSVPEVVSAIAEPDIVKSNNTEGTSTTVASRRINHNIDSHDMEILNTKSVQCLLQSEWAKKLLKSSRLREDILSVDSAPNRQGDHQPKCFLSF